VIKTVGRFFSISLIIYFLGFNLCTSAFAAEYDSRYDLTYDGSIDFEDLSWFVERWLADCSVVDCYGANFNNDNDFIDFADFTLLAGYWGLNFSDIPKYDPAYDLTNDGIIDANNLSRFTQRWLYDCSVKDCYGTNFAADNNNIDFVDYALFAKHWGTEFPGDLDLSHSTIINRPWATGSRPVMLNNFDGVHPRLLLTQARIDELKSKITSGTHKDIWLIIKAKADDYLTDSPNNEPDEESPTRKDGDAPPWLALAYLMTDNSTYLNKAIDWMTTVCSYSEWDENNSLAAGHCLMGVSVAYDWLCNYMTASQKDDILFGTSGTRGLVYFADAMAYGSPKQEERYLSNHCQVEYAGLAAAGFALYDDDVNAPNAEDWLRMAYNIFDAAYTCFANDGSSTEGHQYFGLMTEFQMHFNKMAKELMDIDFYSRSKWLQNMGYFILHSTLPDFDSSNCVMRYGDTKYNHYYGHGPIYQLFNVADEYNDAYLEWLALEMLDRSIGTADRMGWANLLWYDETITPQSWNSLPTFHYCEDTGWLTSRSDWSSNAVMVGFKCGPFHGHKLQPFYYKQVDESWPEYQTIVNGHGHPDVCHFNVYAYGEWLAVDDGYSKPKHTDYHNTILVDGDGQLGEWNPVSDSSWFDRNEVISAKGNSTIIKWENRADYDYIIGDAGNIYRDGNLTKFHRHFVYIKPDVIVMVDELEATAGTAIQWRLHPGGSVSGSGDNYLVSNGSARMDVDFAHPGSITSGVSSGVLTVDLTSTGQDLLVSVLHPRLSTGDVSAITSFSVNGSVIEITIQIGIRTINVELDIAAHEVNIT